jgi:hypothetical protein
LSIIAALLAVGLYLIWMPAFRIHDVEANGPSSETARLVVQKYTSGSYAYIVPRNSVFFYPQERIRSAILDASPDVSAVSLRRTSFTSLVIETTPRAKAFIWCGTSIDAPVADGSCYDADIDGLIFKKDPDQPSPAVTGTSTQRMPQGDIRVFGALDRDIPSGGSPVRAHMVAAARIPDALKFVDAVRELKAPVSALAIRGDEADLWLSGPMRITYVLGHEQDAALLAASTLPTISLTDGTINYIDLRFPGKAYIGRNGQ